MSSSCSSLGCFVRFIQVFTQCCTPVGDARTTLNSPAEGLLTGEFTLLKQNNTSPEAHSSPHTFGSTDISRQHQPMHSQQHFEPGGQP